SFDSASDGDGFGVGRGNRARIDAEPVEPACELYEVALERELSVALERRERLQGRPVPAAEEGDELLGRLEPERERALGDFARADAGADQVAEMTLAAPEHRRRHTGGRRH